MKTSVAAPLEVTWVRFLRDTQRVCLCFDPCVCLCEFLCGYYLFFFSFFGPQWCLFSCFASVCQFSCDGLSLKKIWRVCVWGSLLLFVFQSGKIWIPEWHLTTFYTAINQHSWISCLVFLLLVGVLSNGSHVIHYFPEREKQRGEHVWMGFKVINYFSSVMFVHVYLCVFHLCVGWFIY